MHYCLNCVGAVKENRGVRKIEGEEPCSGEEAYCLDVV
jgi:hypothetical protein